ncbi:MAG: 23S rRNA (adenine(1618)-N(6))-methyltransferase RlmF [Bacteroidales bacterium]|nr:23S rRNA (adenine(1618)-N(6))-methyltransferase RlmF [Bacteroidales bacterium]
MSKEKNQQLKTNMHPRNRNREQYNISALISVNPQLANYIKPNRNGEDSVDFSNPVAVKILNKSLLKYYYNIEYWEFPDENLCPPIPGRADYIHHMADLLCESNFGAIPTGDKIRCFDIGVGASCIYPIIGVTEYNWTFIGSEIDLKSIESAQNIVNRNPLLQNKVEFRWQKDKKDVFFGIIGKEEKIDLSICNPPFHSSIEDAQEGTQRKVKNLSGKELSNPILNFSGTASELVFDGGEYAFIHNMIRESEKFAKNCFWFSTLVSKQSNLKGIYKALEKFEAKQVKTKPMGTGNKSTRIVAWTFLSEKEQKEWVKERWITIKN